MSIKHIFFENVILTLGDIISRQHVKHDLDFLRKAATWNERQIAEFQNNRLRQLVNHAIEHVPYYRQLGLAKDSVRTIDDLKLLPITSKQFIRTTGPEQFVAEGSAASGRSLSHSSGSTGEPFAYYVSSEARSMNTAVKLLTWIDAGYHLGDHYINIKNAKRKGAVKKLQDLVNNCTWVSFFDLDGQHTTRILDLIEKEKPLFVRSYPAPLYLIAQQRNNAPKGKYKHRPKRIFTTGSNLTDQMRFEIEKAFGCDIIDSYSCEGTADTYETPAHDGYHLAKVYGITEILDENGNPVTNGMGRVVSTDLWNSAQPFIRYDTQDYVEIKDGVIQRIIGRESDTIADIHGHRLSVHSFNAFFNGKGLDVGLVKGFQIVCHKDQSITFRIETTPRFDQSAEQKIKEYWSRELGCVVKIEHVENLPLMKNNKRAVIVNE